jgi:hypothetical protein
MKALIAAITAAGLVATFALPATAQGSGSGTSASQTVKKTTAKKKTTKKPAAGSGSGSR